MRDFTHVLETEIIPVVQSQYDAYQELQTASRQIFKTMAETQQALDEAESAIESRWQGVLDNSEDKIKQLEEDIASMISQMKDQDRRTQRFKDKMEQKVAEAEEREEGLKVKLMCQEKELKNKMVTENYKAQA